MRFRVMEGDDPMKSEEVTDNKLSVLAALIKVGITPYADFGVWKPFGQRAAKTLNSFFGEPKKCLVPNSGSRLSASNHTQRNVHRVQQATGGCATVFPTNFAHVCEVCFKPHRTDECSRHPGWTPPSKGAGNCKGQYKGGK